MAASQIGWGIPLGPINVTPTVISDNFAGLASQELVGRPTDSQGGHPWAFNTRPQNTGDMGIVASETRGGKLLPSRAADRSSIGASYDGIVLTKIPLRWEISFGFDPGGSAGPWKVGTHFWDSTSGAGETVPGHFSFRYGGWGFDAGNRQSINPLLTPFGGNIDNMGDTTKSSGTWVNGNLNLGQTYTAVIELVGVNTLKFTFPVETGNSPVTITDDRLAIIDQKGICMLIFESERKSSSSDSRDYFTSFNATIA